MVCACVGAYALLFRVRVVPHEGHPPSVLHPASNYTLAYSDNPRRRVSTYQKSYPLPEPCLCLALSYLLLTSSKKPKTETSKLHTVVVSQ